MSDSRLIPDWRDVVVFSEQGLQPQLLTETDRYKAVVGGLMPGGVIPPHAEGPALFHFLEGTGRVRVDDAELTVQAGATVIVPDGAERGMEAITRLAFLAVRLPR